LKETLTDDPEENLWSRTLFFFQQTLTKKVVVLLAVFCSFLAPITVLFFLDPASFQLTWKGRTFYLFFLWLIILELFLSWEDFQPKTPSTLKSVRNIVLAAALLLPTLYVVAANYFGLNEAILSLSRQFNVPWINWMPLSIEYLAFTALFVTITTIAFRLDGLKDFSISAFFLGSVGTIYLIDNFYPHGTFWPFQIFVPITATFAALVLNFMGYQTKFYPSQGGMPVLQAQNSQGSAVFGIAWPCSGVQSFLLYTIVMALFLKKTAIPITHKIIYFTIGAVVTYFVNILRIATIFVIAINQGDWRLFHDYYGELYSMTWIIAYPLIIIGSRMLWAKLKPKLGVNNGTRRLFRQRVPEPKS